jgi:transposase-like protein
VDFVISACYRTMVVIGKRKLWTGVADLAGGDMTPETPPGKASPAQREGRTMKRLRFTEEQIIAVLREQEAGVPTAEVCRKHGVSSATFYKWKAKYGGPEVSEAKRLRALEDEKGRLRRMLADAMLDNAALKDLLGKSGDARRASGGDGVSASEERRRFGYRRLHVLLRREGHAVNGKRVQRLYREERLTVRRRGGRKRAIGTRWPSVTPLAAAPKITPLHGKVNLICVKSSVLPAPRPSAGVSGCSCSRRGHLLRTPSRNERGVKRQDGDVNNHPRGVFRETRARLGLDAASQYLQSAELGVFHTNDR